MGNKSAKSEDNIDSVYKQKEDHFKIVKFNASFNDSLRSFLSFRSQQSVSAVSTRPWSRNSRRRWKESTLALPYELSKTAWPVSQLEAVFLPEFPIIPGIDENNFEIVEEINKGAFARVYKVLDLAKGQIFALKVLSKSRILREQCVQQVKEEVQIQKLCGHHPFIVNCHTHWQNRKLLFIVSDFVEGGELHNLLKVYGVLPVALVQLYVAQIALVLDFLHNAGVIYRDLKPENILLDSEGNLNLIDFGLSKWLSYGQTTNTICGTPKYMAPEILSADSYGHAADWWSLGIMACVMLTKKFPSHVTENDSTTSDPQDSYMSLPGDDLDVPSRDLLLRLLEIEPSKRLKSVRKLETIPFFHNYSFKDVMDKKVSPRELFQKYFPNGPPQEDEVDQAVTFPDFDEEMQIEEIDHDGEESAETGVVIEEIIDVEVSPRELFQKYFPNGPPQEDEVDQAVTFPDFDEEMQIEEIDDDGKESAETGVVIEEIIDVEVVEF